MATFAESLNSLASWATTTQAAYKNVQAAVAPPKPAPVQMVSVQGGNIQAGQYAFDWRVLAAVGGVLVLLLVVKLTSKG